MHEPTLYINRRSLLRSAVATTLLTGPLGAVAAQPDGEPSIPPVFASAIDLDAENMTVTLPLYRGEGPDDGDVFYVITESTVLGQAVRRGVNWAPKLSNALGTGAVQQVEGRQVGRDARDQTSVRFRGTVDFDPEREVVPGPDGFPVSEDTTPGAVGDSRYSPLFTISGQRVFNGPHVANDTGTHDNVVEIDESNLEVTLRLVDGFYEGQRVLYISTDASDPQIAALEGATYASSLNDAPSAADRRTATSAREPIIPVVNGPMGADNPDRQGLRSAVAGEGGPLNVIAEEQVCDDPSERATCPALDYSPLWDVHPVVWTAEAIEGDQRQRITSHQQAIQLFQEGLIESGAPDGPVNPTLGSLRAAGVVVNCPLMVAGGAS